MAGEAITVELAWPPRQLSPNGRVHHMEAHRFKVAAKDAAYWHTRAAMGLKKFHHDGGDVPILIAASPITGKAAPDDDNLIASLKATLDGIAKAIGVDDKHFRPTLQWAEPVPRGKVIITIGAGE